MRSRTTATEGNRNESSAMVKRPMRRVEVNENERTVVTTRATVRANISSTPDVGRGKALHRFGRVSLLKFLLRYGSKSRGLKVQRSSFLGFAALGQSLDGK